MDKQELIVRAGYYITIFPPAIGGISLEKNKIEVGNIRVVIHHSYNLTMNDGSMLAFIDVNAPMVGEAIEVAYHSLLTRLKAERRECLDVKERRLKTLEDTISILQDAKEMEESQP